MNRRKIYEASKIMWDAIKNENNINSLPKELIPKSRKEAYEIQKAHKFFTDYELKNILDSIRHMNRADNTHLLEKFKTFTTGLDLYRNESFESTFPEFASWYQKI